MKGIYGYETGDSTEARVCTERWLAVLCRKKNQPDTFSINHGRNSILPGLVAAYTSQSTQHLFPVREKSLENTCASALPQAHLPATHSSHASPPLTRPRCCFSATQWRPQALHFIHFRTAPLAGKRCQQTAMARLEGLSPPPTRADHTPAFLQTRTQQQWPGDHPVHFKPPRKDKIGCVG